MQQGTVAPYAYLTEDGLLCSINAEYTPVESELDAAKKNKGSQQKVTDASVFSEELLMAGSTAKQAEVAAKQIYRIRESRLNILTGEADNLPPDGEAMKLVIQQLEEQITQFGTREGLAPVMFEDKKAPVKVLFYPETGAIKQIIQ